MRLFEGESGPEIRMVFVLQILSAVIGAMILPVGVDPRGHADPFFGAEPNIIMLRIKILRQLACISSETEGRQIVIVAGFGMVFADHRDEPALYDILIRPVEEHGQLAR